jgi:hypothetical protein
MILASQTALVLLTVTWVEELSATPFPQAISLTPVELHSHLVMLDKRKMVQVVVEAARAVILKPATTSWHLRIALGNSFLTMVQASLANSVPLASIAGLLTQLWVVLAARPLLTVMPDLVVLPALMQTPRIETLKPSMVMFTHAQPDLQMLMLSLTNSLLLVLEVPFVVYALKMWTVPLALLLLRTVIQPGKELPVWVIMDVESVVFTYPGTKDLGLLPKGLSTSLLDNTRTKITAVVLSQLAQPTTPVDP